jgi:hypothetical protein
VFSLDTFSDAKFTIATGVSILTLLLTTVFGPLEAFLKIPRITLGRVTKLRNRWQRIWAQARTGPARQTAVTRHSRPRRTER